MRQFVIVGLGQFGTHLARQLTEQHCEVLVLDRSQARVASVRDDVHRALIGDARDPDTIKSAIPGNVDGVAVCLGDNMEASILCTLHLSAAGVERILATAVNQDHATILTRVGAKEVIFPDLETAERIARRMAHPNMLDYFPFAEEHRIMEIVVPRPLIGQELRASGLRNKYRLMVLAVKQPSQQTFEFMPDADYELTEGDILIVLGRELDLARFSSLE